jgi:hypothetical protein
VVGNPFGVAHEDANEARLILVPQAATPLVTQQPIEPPMLHVAVDNLKTAKAAVEAFLGSTAATVELDDGSGFLCADPEDQVCVVTSRASSMNE